MITKIKKSIKRYVKSRIEAEEQQMQKFVKQLNDTFPETRSQKSPADSTDRPDSLDLSLSESEYQILQKKVGSLVSLIHALRKSSKTEKSSGQ